MGNNEVFLTYDETVTDQAKLDALGQAERLLLSAGWVIGGRKKRKPGA